MQDVTINLSELFIARVAGKQHNISVSHIDTLRFVNMLSDGVEGTVLRTVAQHIPKLVLSVSLGSDITNLSKLYRRKKLTPKQTESLEDLTALWEDLRALFDNDDELIHEWIQAPLPAFEGGCAMDIMGSSFGRKRIREVLEEMKYGEFA
ncbi:MbcA/ParS/Xre antitoxin family protein [Alteromonas sp. 14N.309.X.WAT.G.H12]|uniref:MbcA/ParS/Xre antitoxin family protein n=1 Tax=Alteromonas sp. 14N.309.X.WAT.G.H12 TaxID=3120824 RepID=UPI002FD5B865